ncbi:MAG: hypothetical protein K2O71_07735 [Lachnospiraceae bacterium]|nr:hypothetical protein [Lachnospiraceae bacterium]
MMKNRNVLSLFSSAGIGELGLAAAELSVLVSNEMRICWRQLSIFTKASLVNNHVIEADEQILSDPNF